MNESQILSLIAEYRREQAEYNRLVVASLAEFNRLIIENQAEYRRDQAEYRRNQELILERLDTQHKIVVDKLDRISHLTAR